MNEDNHPSTAPTEGQEEGEATTVEETAPLTGEGALDENGREEVHEADAATDVERLGTTSSARFNILSTMVGGGSLSLPLAFQKSGNALLGPFMLLLVAVITEFCFRIHGTSVGLVTVS